MNRTMDTQLASDRASPSVCSCDAQPEIRVNGIRQHSDSNSMPAVRFLLVSCLSL